MGSLLLGLYASRAVNPDGPDASLGQLRPITSLEGPVLGVLRGVVWCEAPEESTSK